MECSQVGEGAFYYPGRVITSSSLNQRSAYSRELPHISSDGCSPEQHPGRSGRPKMAQRNSASRCTQGCPAGLFSELIDGAMQQAPQPGRQSSVGEASIPALSHRCRRLAATGAEMPEARQTNAQRIGGRPECSPA